ncbi:MAG: ATP synthase F1 subunit gamma [Myxococcaceae bacterium]|jgi:F-type H+-transporting ATPase subunit gamma|nr:ATP synthase F1 subunit gamma [Myxococcaceae bacterium]MCA3011347.1 ATP synthase F1 subunit gamma [Myxococcaceae bacterium]
MGLRDIRKRIKSVKNTRQITKAMKMVSAAKLRKAQDNVIAARPYAQTLDAVMAQLLSKEPGEVSHPLLTRREVKRIEFVVVSSDRGLAGGFNSNITRRALKFLAEHAKHEVFITTVGRKAGDFLRGRGYPIRKDWPGAFGKLGYATAEAITAELSERFLSGQVDAVFFLFNEFVSAISQVPNLQQLLPFEPKADGGGKPAGEYAYEPSPQAVLEKLVPQAVTVKVYRGLLESFAAEHAARMAAMENATKNAGEMIGTLTLFYNRTRQALITKELMEIVSGAEALKG